ncbi:hypothetical protein SDC9_203015 [bioreactor metagenome]|uniref:TRAP C4-dicarboxylate transport system permease DctM subunit domain-containing protein n=1 Tax=bioreactor metagenome TaxID=1076179 RepID=A0A645J768_9ZZZZ
MITPPLGVNLFVAQSIAKCSFDSVVKEIIPLLIALIAILLVCVFFPQIVLWLPGVLGLI